MTLNPFARYTRRDLSLLIGNTLDRFDTALYGFLAPLLAPLFFPNHSKIVQLILAYSVLGSSLITRPLGSLIFGVIARHHGPLKGLSWSLIGVGITTLSMALLPTYESIGWLAPLWLILLRMIKGTFAEGENVIARFYIMEGKTAEKARRISHLYQSTTMMGIILASAIATLVIALPYENGWRVCYLLGGLTGFIGYFLRLSSKATPEDTKPIASKLTAFSSLQVLWCHKKDILCVATILGFSYLSYSIPCIFMNSFVPLVTNTTLEEMMSVNTALLIFDMMLLPVLGRYLLRFQPLQVMITATLMIGVTIPPLFQGLINANLPYIIFVRFWIIFWGVALLCPLNFWLKNRFPSSDNYLLIGMAGSIGSSTIGRLTVPLCFWLWSVAESALLPAFYVTLLSLFALFAFWILNPQEKVSLLKPSCIPK